MDSIEAWLEHLEGLDPNRIELGLERVRQVYSRFSFDRLAACTLVVAGTNGKGSTLSCLENILLAAGYSVAKYSSPHLFCFNERIMLNGQQVEDDLLLEAFDYVEKKRQGVFLSYFEFTTLAAFYCIAHSKVDFALLEIGLGGRLDAVNIVAREINIITNIELDHQDWLGNTREQIAAEKGGIIRTEVPLVVGDPEPPQSLREQLKQAGCRVCYINRHFFLDHKTLVYQDKQQSWNLSSLVKGSSSQMQNLAVALQAVSLLLEQGYSVSAENILQGISKSALPGRQSYLSEGKFHYMLDVAHNPASVQALADRLSSADYKNLYAVFSVMDDKDIEGMVACLAAQVKCWFVCSLDHPRAISKEDLERVFSSSSLTYRWCQSPETALGAAKQQASAQDLIVVFGSFYLLAALKQQLPL